MMFLIYKFIVSGTDIDKKSLNLVWIVASQHSQLIDAQSQLNIFINSGIESKYLRELTDQDPVPTDIVS